MSLIDIRDIGRHLRGQGFRPVILGVRRPTVGGVVAAVAYRPTDGGERRWAVVRRVEGVWSSTLDLDAGPAVRQAIREAHGECHDQLHTGGPDA